MSNLNSQYMKLAIKEAWKYQLLTYPNPAVGATVVKNNQVLSVQAHKEAGLPHAEVLALKEAYLKEYPTSILKDIYGSSLIHNYLIENHNDFFNNCEIYVTLEPCNHIGKTPACAMLLESLKIQKVYIGTLDPNKNATGGVERLKNANIEVEIGVCKMETDKLLYPFLCFQSGHFSFFKMAMREDGSIGGGYITSQDSLNLVHEIRTKIDLMVIGGNTVRTDRPTLDTRFGKIDKSPDILIYSSNKEFDNTIPLFNIKDRKVTITSELELINNKKFIMIEGGYNLFNSIKNKINYLMIFISHKVKLPKDESNLFVGYEIEYSYYLNKYDEIVFLKRIND